MDGLITAEGNIRFISSGSGIIRRGGLYPSRKNDYNELVYVTEGCLYICEDYRRFSVQKGEIIILDRFRRRYGYLASDSDTAFRRAVFGGDTGSERKIFTPAHPERISMLLDMLTLYSSLPEYPAAALDSVMRLILIELFIYGMDCGDGKNRRAILCAKVCDYINETGGTAKISQIAAHFGYTSGYLTEIFRSFYSKGIKAYTDSVRLSRIKELLASGLSLSETAAETGFASKKAMQDFFRYRTNTSLRELN
jgi:AraC-like DNA-binding protein